VANGRFGAALFDSAQNASPELRNDCPADGSPRERLMMDILMLAIVAAFFAAGLGYAYACERL
jgi:hypothetical protein